MAKKRTTKTAKTRAKQSAAGTRANSTKKSVKKSAKKSAKKSVARKKSGAAKSKPGLRKPAKRKTSKPAAKKSTVKAAAKKPAAKRAAAKKTSRSTKKITARKIIAKPVTPPPKKQKSGLTARDLAELRTVLLAKRAELIGNVNNLHAEAMRTDSAGDMSSMPIHMADIGTDNYEQEFTLGLIESERAILQEIEDALHRMVDKTYGLCVGTGMPIGKKRLKANPWAKYSYEYKLAQEKGMMRRF